MLAPFALGDVLHGAEHAAGPARLVSDHIAHTADEPHLAVRPDHAVFHVVPQPAPTGLRHRGRPHLTGCGVEALLALVKAQEAFLTPKSNDAVIVVGPSVAI